MSMHHGQRVPAPANFADCAKAQKDRRKICHLAIISLTAFASCITSNHAAYATQYYISTKGSDMNSGTSASQPWLHFWQANKVLKPGDTLTVLNDGIYDRKTNPCNILVSGTADAWITINAADLTRPKIVGNSSSPAIYVKAAYVKINGLDATSGPDSLASAIMIVSSHHVSVLQSLAHDSGGGGIVAAWSDYIWIVGNSVYRNAYTNPNQPSGISLGYGFNSDTQPGVHNVVAGNVSYLNMNKVETPAGYTTDGNGIIVDRMADSGTYVGTSVVQNNVVHSNGGRGIAVWHSDNVLVRNNTAYHNLTDPNMVKSYLGEIQISYCNNCSAHNNISSTDNTSAYPILALKSTNTVIDYNLTFGGKSPWIYPYMSTNVAIGTHNIKNTDPLFAPDTLFKLQPTSPALEAGDPSHAPSTDILGTPRRPTGPIDMGAYQQS
jgi:parallel beta-helix repeat protein